MKNGNLLSSVELFLCVAFIGLYIYVSHILSQLPRLRWIPESVIIILFGCFVTGVITLASNDFSATFDTEIFFKLLLPPIIFTSGFKMNLEEFFGNLTSIMVYANLGTVVNIIVFGAAIYGVGKWNLSTGLTLTESMSFGSVISATDPVTTIAIFDHLHVEPALYVIVVGVSILDDAVSIIMFELFNEFIDAEGREVQGSSTNHGAMYYIAVCVLQFILIFGGSAAIGQVFGTLFALFARRNESLLRNPILFHMLILCSLYTCYLAVDALQMSGIIAVMFSGMATQRYLRLFAAPETLEAATHAVSLTAQLFETIVFFMIGYSLLQNTPSSGQADGVFVLWSLLLTLLSRAAQIYPLAWALNAYNGNGCSWFIDTHQIKKAQRKKSGGIALSSGDYSNVMLSGDSEHGHNNCDSWSGDEGSQSGGDVEMGERTFSTSRDMEDDGETKTHSNAWAREVDGDSTPLRDPRITNSPNAASCKPQIMSLGYQHVLFVAGLRGPVAYATSKLFPNTHGHSNLVAVASTAVVLVTILLLGPLTIPTLKSCGVRFGDGDVSVVACDPSSQDDFPGTNGQDSSLEHHIDVNGVGGHIDDSSTDLADFPPQIDSERESALHRFLHCTFLWRSCAAIERAYVTPLFWTKKEEMNADSSRSSHIHTNRPVDTASNPLIPGFTRLNSVSHSTMSEHGGKLLVTHNHSQISNNSHRKFADVESSPTSTTSKPQSPSDREAQRRQLQSRDFDRLLRIVKEGVDLAAEGDAME